MSRRPAARLSIVAFALAVATIATYAPVRHHEFVNFDDGEYVVENDHVATGLSADNVRWAVQHSYEGTGGPLTWLSHMADVQWFGLDPGAHHVTNLVLHVLNTQLLFFLLWRLTGESVATALVAALFAVHPLHVESVAWIAERKDVLSTLFLFLTLHAYVSYAAARSIRRYLVVAVLLIAGLLAKPIVATAPFLMLLLDIWPMARIEFAQSWLPQLRRLVVEKLPLVAPCVAALVLTWRAQQVDAVAGLDVLPLTLRLANASVSYVTYVVKMFWPTHLAVFYPYPSAIPLVLSAGCFLLLIAVTAWTLSRLAKQPYLAVGWLWFAGSLLPVIGIVQVGGHAMADRFTYVPLIGLFIAVVWTALDLGRRSASIRNVLLAVALIATAALGVTARGQVAHWRDSTTLWTHAIAVTRDNDRAHANRGVVLAKAGRDAEAIVEYREALRIDPNLPLVHHNLGLALQHTGQPAAALAAYRHAIRLAPGYAKAHQDLGVLLAREGRAEEAIREWQEALRLAPELIEARVNIATTSVDLGRLDDALSYALDAVRLAPRNARWHYVAANVYAMRGETAQAIRQLETALELAPDYEDARLALRELKGGCQDSPA